MKRPKFLPRFLRTAVIYVLIAWSVLAVYFTLDARNYNLTSEDEFMTERTRLFEEIKSYVQQHYQYRRPNTVSGPVKYMLCNMYENYGVDSVFYLNEYRIADSSRQVFAVSTDSILEIADLSYIEPLRDYLGDRYPEYMSYDNDDDDVAEVYMSSFLQHYAKSTFIPEKVFVAKPDKNYNYWKAVDIFDNTALTDSLPSKAKVGFIQQDKNEVVNSGSTKLVDIGNPGQLREVNVNITDIKITDNVSRMNLEVSDYTAPDYMVINRGRLALAYSVSFAVLLIVAAVVSAFKHYHDRSQYEMFEYRRKMTRAMTHDLKTPLAAISAYAENLNLDVNTDKREYYSSRIISNVSVMSKMIEEILDYSRSESSERKAVKTQNVSIRTLINEVADETKPLMELRGISVMVLTNDDINVRTDRELMKQVIQNLFSNCAKYALEDTTVTVSIEDKGFSVSNLTEEIISDAEKLKEPFVKGDSSRHNTEGAGLGLAIADNNLKLLGYSLKLSLADGMFKAEVIMV